MRRVISDIINSNSDYEVADVARDGVEGFEKISANPKFYSAVIMDINMPRMNGIELLHELQKHHIEQTVIVVSTVAKEGARETIQALEYGAFDFVTKPENYLETKGDEFKHTIHEMLDVATNSRACIERMKGASDRKKDAAPPHVSSASSKTPYAASASSAVPHTAPASSGMPRTSGESSVRQSVSEERNAAHMAAAGAGHGDTHTMGHDAGHDVKTFDTASLRGVKRGRKKLVALACSTGGPKSLQQVIPYLPENLDAGVVLVQHMPKGFTNSLAQRLNELSSVTVKEAEEGDIIRKGHVYIAPGGMHMKVIPRGTEFSISLSDEPPVGGLRPCADVMYNSLEQCGYDELTCVVLTGMGADGTSGIRNLKKANKSMHVISQDEQTSIVYGMPKAVAQAGLVDEVVPLERVAEAITKNVGVL